MIRSPNSKGALYEWHMVLWGTSHAQSLTLALRMSVSKMTYRPSPSFCNHDWLSGLHRKQASNRDLGGGVEEAPEHISLEPFIIIGIRALKREI